MILLNPSNYLKKKCLFIALFLMICSSLTIFPQRDFDPNEKGQCPQGENAAYRWDNKRNLCVLKKSSAEGREAFQKCQAMEDLKDRKECFENNRDHFVGEDNTVIDDPLEGKLSTVTASVPMAFFIISAITNKASTGTPSCLSKKIFKAASIAGIGAEAYFKLLAGRIFKKLQKDYEKLEEEDPYSMQIAAFKFLEDQQREVAKIAGRQKKLYTVLAVSYVSAATLAVLESTAILGKPCSQRSSASQSGGQNPTLSKLFNLLGHSPGIAIVSGVMTSLYTILAKAAGEDQKNALKRAEVAKEIREKFEHMYTTAQFCPSRDNRERPNCYCYTDEGKRNSLRTKSETCQQFWDFHDRDLFVSANNKGLTSANFRDREGCVNKQQQFDADCECLKNIDERGQSSCYETLVSANTFNDVPSGTEIQDSIKDLNKITSGGLSGHNFGGSDLKNKAARANFRLKKIFEKQDAINKKNGEPSIKRVLGSINSGFKAQPPNLSLASSSLARGMDKNSFVPSNLQKNIKKSLNTKALKSIFSRKKLQTKKKKNQSIFNESASHAPKIMGDFMDKNYDYSKGQSDIVKIKERSLWRIISYRYIQTGLERIFED